MADGSFETRRLTPETVNLYHLNEHFIKPMCAERRCSYVELVASGPQPPAWFVSHWWGEPVTLFLRCIEQHAAVITVLTKTQPTGSGAVRACFDFCVQGPYQC